MLYKPRAHIILDVPKFGSRTEAIAIEPIVIEARWTKNDHLTADELTCSVGWKEGGIDPRALRNARCAFYLWDAHFEDFDELKHIRFVGIARKAQRKLNDRGWVVELTFHDYTALFLENKPYATTGIPEWSMTLKQIWELICDNTGWYDPANKKIMSNVLELKDRIVFDPPELGERSIGDMVSARFHKVAKPTPPHGASSWDVWQWCIQCLGLVSAIDKDQCIVRNKSEHYTELDAASVMYGSNIYDLEEDTDTTITTKGIHMRSFDTLNGHLIESFYPPPGDERLKAHRAAVKPKSDGGTLVTENEASGDYEPFTNWSIHTQEELDAAAFAAYEERRRQELHGTFKTAEMRIDNVNGDTIDILGLRAGDAIQIQLDPKTDRDVLEIIGDKSAQWAYLINTLGYDPKVAELIVENFDVEALKNLTYHIGTLETSLTPDKFEIVCKYHNRILI